MKSKLTTKKLIEKIKDVVIFKDIDVKNIESILKKIKYQIIEFKENEILAFRGEEVKGLYIIISGNFFSEMSGINGKIKKIEDFQEKNILAGAFIFGKNNKFPVDVFSRTSGRLLFIEKKELLKMLQLNEKLIKNILDLISQKAQFLSYKIWQEVNNKTIKKKLIDYILQNMKNNEIYFKPSLNEVANLFNIQRPSLSRVLISFVEDGILEKKGRKYIIKNIEKLKK